MMQRTVWRSSRLFLFIFLFVMVVAWKGNADASQIHLSWIDNSNDEDGFFIERKTGDSGDFVQIAVQSANLDFYNDNDFTPRTQYCYRVRAFNQAGVSEYSNEACLVTSALVSLFESPGDSQVVSGVSVIRGWGFNSEVEGQISSVDLFIDGMQFGSIPCCSVRNDVQAAFPQFPSGNTANSGWGITINWGLFSAGSHTVQARLQNTAGETQWTELANVTVVKAGGFEVLDQFSLAGATASIDQNDLVVGGVIIQDKATQQQQTIDARFRWTESSQSLAMVDVVTRDTMASQSVPWRLLFTPFVTAFEQFLAPKHVSAAAGLHAAFEGPEDAQAVSGIGVVRGWAFAEQSSGYPLNVQFLVDGQLNASVPCCSLRTDVASAYPDFPQASNSGWGMTFNYNQLNEGFHNLGVQILSSAGDSFLENHGVTVVRLGGFEFLDQFDLSAASIEIRDGTLLALQGVQVRDKGSGQTSTVNVTLQWRPSLQGLVIVGATES